MIEFDNSPEGRAKREVTRASGRLAFDDGFAISENPYNLRSIEHHDWKRGWLDAEKEEARYRAKPEPDRASVINFTAVPSVEPIVTDVATSCPQIADAARRAAAEAQRIADETDSHLPSWHPLGGKPPRITPAGHHAHFDYEVKSWPWFFEPMVAGKKLHDMRDKTERPYQVGDRMLLREFDPRGVGYTGREAVAMITYITSNETPCAMSSNALAKDACILSVAVTEIGETDRNA